MRSGLFPVISVNKYVMLLLLLSCFSRVWLCVTPYTAAHQCPPFLGFSRQEHWSGLPFPSPRHESEKPKWNRSVVSDSLRPHGPQPTRSFVHGILQARVREWVPHSHQQLQPSNVIWWPLRKLRKEKNTCNLAAIRLQLRPMVSPEDWLIDWYGRNDFSESRLLNLPIHRKTLNSLTWDIWFSLINNNFIFRLPSLSGKTYITWLYPLPSWSSSLRVPWDAASQV